MQYCAKVLTRCHFGAMWLSVLAFLSLGVAAPGKVRLSDSRYTVSEAAGVVQIAIQRFDGAEGELTVVYSSTNISAVSDIHYVAKSGTVVFGAGDSLDKIIEISILDNFEINDARTFTFTLNSVQGGGTLGAPGSATIIIADDDDVITNPLTVKAYRVDDTHVRLDIRNFAGILAQSNPLLPTVDSVAVWYRAGSFYPAPQRGVATLIGIKPAEMQAVTQGVFSKVVAVAPLPSPADSFYYFCISAFWRLPGTGRDSIPPFTAFGCDSTLMKDIAAPQNPVTLIGYFPPLASSNQVFVDIWGSQLIDTAKTVLAVVQTSLYRDFSALLTSDTLWVPGMWQNLTGEKFVLPLSSPYFVGLVDTLRVGLQLLGKNTTVSARRDTFFVRNLPENQVVLGAAGISSSEIALRWNPLGPPIDSMRILIDTDTILPGKAELFGLLALRSVSVAGGSDTVRFLDASKRYFFAAQVYAGGLWSLITPGAIASDTTRAFSTGEQIVNSVVVQSAWFDSASHRVGLVWSYDAAQQAVGLFGIAAGVDSVATRLSVPQFLPLADKPDTTWIDLGRQIIFNSPFHLFVQLRYPDGPPSGHTAQSHSSVRTKSFDFQPVFYFQSDQDTVFANNGHIVLSAQPGWFDRIVDTLDVFVAPVAQNGFVPVGQGFSFRRKQPSSRFAIGMRPGAIPFPYSFNDVMLYRSEGEGKFSLVSDAVSDPLTGTIRVLTNDLSRPYILLIDTAPPQVVLVGDTSSAIAEGTDLSYNVTVTENSANATFEFMYGKGSQNFVFRSVDTLRGGDAQERTIAIPGALVTIDGGVRAMVIVSDGRTIDTTDLSRQVRTESYSEVSTERRNWEPVHVSIDLDNKDVGGVLSRLLGQNEPYNIKKVRLFKWADTPGGPGAWAEYSPGNNDHLFALNPGNLFWIKAAESVPLQFGPGETVSLKDPVIVQLAPGAWTDFAVPFGYSIRLSDVLESSGTNAAQLQFYQWSEWGSTYRCVPYYVPGSVDPLLTNTDREMSAAAKTGAYTVLNPLAEAAALVLRPLPYALSRTLGKTGVVGAQGTGWAFRFKEVLPQSGAAAPFAFIGYESGEGSQRRFLQPPSFGQSGITVGTVDSEELWGGIVDRGEMHGKVYRIRFAQSGQYRVEQALALPQGVFASLWSPTQGGTPVAESQEVTVTDSELEQLFVVGSQTFVSSFASTAGKLRFAVTRLHPNPFRSGVAIQYQLPYVGVASVTVRIFDPAGRCLWQRRVDGIRGIAGEVRWNGIGPHEQPVSCGTYIVSLSATDDRGRLVGSGRQQVVKVP